MTLTLTARTSTKRVGFGLLIALQESAVFGSCYRRTGMRQSSIASSRRGLPVQEERDG